MKYFLTLLLILGLGMFIGCDSSKLDEKLTAKKSKPNFLIIVADDLGYTDIEPFGGEINTPNLAKLATEGAILTNFHVLPTCSPTRSVLLSGADNHINGLGSMVTTRTKKQTGKPGYEGYLNDKVVKLPEILQQAGYRTYISGKWHLGHTQEHSPFNNGFAESFVLLSGGGSHYADKIPLSPTQEMVYRRNGKVVEELPADFYSTRNYTDYMLQWLEKDKNSGKPFFAYLAYTAPHDPLHAPKDFIDKYKDNYIDGYEELLIKRFKRLQSIGFLPANIDLPKWPERLKGWNSLSKKEQEISARTMAVYAAMIDYMDNQIGRVLTWLQENGELNNTVIVFFSDNGANAAPRETYPGQTDEFLNSLDNRLENIGLSGSYVATSPTWATASTAPYKYFKVFTTEGGIKSPCILWLPDHYKMPKKINILTHVSDLFPTLLDMANASYSMQDDHRFSTLTGQSWIPMFNGNLNIIRDKGIGYELFGNRAYIKDEWKIVSTVPPFGSGEFELYNLKKDPFERTDLSAKMPDKREELIGLWNDYAKRVGVVYDPIDASQIKMKE